VHVARLAALWTEYKRLHQVLVQIVGRDELCQRLCRIPGVGPVTALSVKAAIDDPRRFVKSKTVGAHIGLTSRRIQTGDSIDIEGRISKCGDGEVRTVLYEASSAMLVRAMVQRQSMGVADRSEARPQTRGRRGGTQPGSDHASDVAERQRVPFICSRWE
jgi:transposase